MRGRPLPESQIRRIGKLYRDGWGAIEIGRRLGLPEGTVRNVLRGYTKRSRAILGGRLMQGMRHPDDQARYKK